MNYDRFSIIKIPLHILGTCFKLSEKISDKYFLDCYCLHSVELVVNEYAFLYFAKYQTIAYVSLPFPPEKNIAKG
jgi:hypothetical protein